MKFIHKLYLSFISVSLVLMLIPVSRINALTEEEKIENELKIAIIDGDGSPDNPYVVDYSKAPYFKEYMDDINKIVMNSLNGNSNSDSITPFGIFDGIMKGTKHTGQTKGGSWTYSSGAPSAAYNGNIWMRAVSYASKADTAKMCDLKTNEYLWNKMLAIGEKLATDSYSDAYKLLISSGITGATATAVLRTLGKVNAVFGAITVLEFIKDHFELTRYETAKSKGYGMIHATFYTSYQGSWYSHEDEDTWTTADTVYEPGTFYGKGTYKSY